MELGTIAGIVGLLAVLLSVGRTLHRYYLLHKAFTLAIRLRQRDGLEITYTVNPRDADQAEKLADKLLGDVEIVDIDDASAQERREHTSH